MRTAGAAARIDNSVGMPRAVPRGAAAVALGLNEDRERVLSPSGGEAAGGLSEGDQI